MILDLMGPAEIAKLFNVSRQRVTQLVAKPDFPEPVADLVMGKVWLGKDVRAWGAKTGRVNTAD